MSRLRAVIDTKDTKDTMNTTGFVSRKARRLAGVGGLVVICAASGACGNAAPEPPVLTPTPGTETINGSERIGWDQRASDAVELASIRYAIYVDGARNELTGVICSTTAASTGYACTARLPALSAGAHTLEIASFVQETTVLESARSAALRVTVVAAAADSAR